MSTRIRSMDASQLRKRREPSALDADVPSPVSGLLGDTKTKTSASGRPSKHGLSKQYVLMFAFASYFLCTCITSHVWQIIVSPLYFVNREYFYAFMSITKQIFGLLINSVTQLFNPTLIRISGDETVADQLRIKPDGMFQSSFPERLILIANHQIYTDWLYMWWISYTARMHGHVFIILKESLKWIPVIGPAMQFFGFIFMARNWAKDKPRIEYRLKKLNNRHSGPMSGNNPRDPMWLLIFPEGTNLSNNGRNASRKFADKMGIPDMQHQLLPRSTGLHFCLEQLQTTVEWVYDCTIAYEGVPRGDYGQDIYTLRSLYFEGRAPKSVNMYWRRFAIASIPLKDPHECEQWVRDRWREKDNLLEQYVATGRFPPNHQDTGVSNKGVSTPDFWETQVRSNSLDFILSFVPAIAGLISVVLFLIWRYA